MVSKRQLNSTKRCLNEILKEIRLSIEEKKESNSWNLIELETRKQQVKTKLEEYRKEFREFADTLPENEESESLLKGYEEVFIDGEKIANSLQIKIGELTQIEKEKEREAMQLEREKEREAMQLEKEKERMMTLELEKMKLEKEERIALENLNVQKLKIESEMKQRTMELEKETELTELKKDFVKNDNNGRTIKLPKLELLKFDGDIFKWQEFWDTFESTINNNSSLSNVEKFNYLRVQLRNEAKETITGLETTEANYQVAVKVLKERYGRKQLIINAHYSKLKEMPVSPSYYEKLQSTYDNIEKHLRSLEALGENVENNLMMSLIQSKFPKHVLARLEEYKGNEESWSVELFRKELKRYITAQEIGNRLTSLNSNNQPKANETKKPFNQRHSTVAFSTSERQKTCIFCKKEHWSDECKEFPDIQSRKNQLIGRCFICLKTNHLLKDCTSKKKCVYCNQECNHHRSLCNKQFQNKVAANVSSMLAIGEHVLMQTATVELENESGEFSTVTRLLLDCGSQRTYITEDMTKRLKLEHLGKNHLNIYTFGTAKPKKLETPIVGVGIRLKSGFIMYIKANVVPEVTGEIERRPIQSTEVKRKLQTFELADTIPSQLETSKIHLLIGNDYYTDIVSSKRKEITDSLHLLSSKIGWILTGRIQSENSNKDFSLLTTAKSDWYSHFHAEDDSIQSQMSPNVDEFWKLETLGINESITETADDKALDDFNATVKNIDGRYHVRWPWKTENLELPDNYQLAYGRLKSIVKRMQESNKDLLVKYNDIIRDQFQKGIVEKVQVEETKNGKVHYIPHHVVVKPERTTTKLRIVYDASAKSNKRNKSLNECMYRGPVIIEDLCGLLLRFRTHKVALIADIEKAFLQIALQDSERDVTRFLWLKDLTKPVSAENLQIYRFARVPFGVIASPFLLSGTIQHHLKSIGSELSLKLSRELYVDNLISGTCTPFDAISLYETSKKLFKDISMNLREWATNSEEVREKIPTSDRIKGEFIKVLGLQWKIYNDTINISTKQSTELESTKRQILKTTAEVFDPLGLFTPVTLQSKLILRELWKENKGWDDPITHTQQQQWKRISKDFENIQKLNISRYIGYRNCKLLCFSDASGQAYATVIYLLTEEDGTPNANVVFSKSRIAPIKSTTIPRLELLAVLIGVRALNFVEKNLNIPILKKILWTDSTCVLNWIKSTKPLPLFVENRLKEIRSRKNIEFRYVNTKENPADLASRGRTLDELRNDNLWWHGPNWLLQEEKTWPQWDMEIIDHKKLENLAKPDKGTNILYEVSIVGTEKLLCHEIKKENGGPYGIKEENFSSFVKLIRVTAWVTRFIYNISNKEKVKGCLSAHKLLEARKMWIKYIQKKALQHLPEQIKKDKNKLNLRTDQDGIIRCHGRLINIQEEKTRCPIYLPKNNHLTKLIINDTHDKLFHAGTSHTLSYLRRTYWIPQGRRQVSSTLIKCGTCKRFQGGPFQMPQMSPWPISKLTRSAPFSYTGLDYMGPLYVKNGDEKTKTWICLLTCVATRALHLEVVDDMTAEQFLMALRRFFSRCGTPKEIICDNAKQFKAAKTAIEQAWNNMITDNSVYDYVSKKEITWTFITEFSPWSGGFYERLVGMVKSSLRKAIGTVCLTKTQLVTFVTEVEAILNSRPLNYVDEDINSARTLTPNDFLKPYSNVGIPVLSDNTDNEEYNPSKETSTDVLLRTWKKGQSHLNRLWKIWYGHYILALRERYQNQIKQTKVVSKCEPKIGDVVHIKEELPRGRWKIGKIEELNLSKDGITRSATVKTVNGHLLKRPLNLLYPMELSECKGEKLSRYNSIANDDQNDKNNEKVKTGNEAGRRRSKREAAQNANLKIQFQINDEFDDEVH